MLFVIAYHVYVWFLLDDSIDTTPPQGKSISELPFLPPDLVTTMEEERMNKRKERELRRKQREERRKQKELRRQQKIQRAAEMYKVRYNLIKS